MKAIPAIFLTNGFAMNQLTLTQMWDESNDDCISTLNSETDSNIDDGEEAVHPVRDNADTDSSLSEHSSHSSQVTVPVVYNDSDAIDGISLQSTQINVSTQLLTQDFHVSNDENAVNVTVSSDADDNNEMAKTEETAEDEDASKHDLASGDEMAEDEEDEEELAEDKYHNFLQTYLGLYHDNIAHQEQVKYLVWVLENYDEFLLHNN